VKSGVPGGRGPVGWMVVFWTMGILAGSFTSRAGNGKWVTTHTWQGSGTCQTKMFWVNGSRWRVRHRHKGTGLFQIVVYNAKGTVLDVAANLTEPIPGVKTFTGRGYRFLAMNCPICCIRRWPEELKGVQSSRFS